MTKGVFAFTDPLTDAVMYVASSPDIEKRMARLQEAPRFWQQERRGKKGEWLTSLIRRGERPGWRLLEECDDHHYAAARAGHYVTVYQAKGEASLNRRRGRPKANTELEQARFYVRVLQRLLDANHIPYPAPDRVDLPGSKIGY